MEIKDLLETYAAHLENANKNLINIAYDEMMSSQYEEAAAHFDQLYVQDSTDYVSYFLRAYCKSHCGRRGDVYPDSQKLTSAFKLSCDKAIALKKDLDTNLYIILKLYDDAMENLAYNAVEEVHVNDNGDTYHTNPTKTKILIEKRENIFDALEKNVEIIKSCNDVKKYAISYLKNIESSNLHKYGPLIIKYDPSYAATYEEKLQKEKKKKKIVAIVGGVIAVVVLIIIIATSV